MRERTILLVEDNCDDEALMMHALQANNIPNRVVVARDGVAALKHLIPPRREAVHELPAVVLLDVQLPKLSGFEVLQRIRADERARLLPVVLLTSSKEEQDLLRGYRLGCNSYVRKPVNFDEFKDVARQLAAYWLGVNECPPIPT